MNNADALLDLLARLLAPRVAAQLASAGAAVFYSTLSPASWPPGSRSKRHARDRIKLAGGEQIGRGRETIWRIERSAFDAHYTHRPMPVAIGTAAAANDDDAIVERALAGMRATNGRRG